MIGAIGKAEDQMETAMRRASAGGSSRAADFEDSKGPDGAESALMIQAETSVGSCAVAVYLDHAAAARAVRRLHEEGFAMADLSIIGRGVETREEPVGFVGPGEYARVGAEAGALFGGLLGLLVGAAVVVVPGLGPVVIAGPLAAALMAGVEAALAGTALGGLAGALVGWGETRERALTYEMHIQVGKFLVVVRGVPGAVARARRLLCDHPHGDAEVYEPAPW